MLVCNITRDLSAGVLGVTDNPACTWHNHCILKGSQNQANEMIKNENKNKKLNNNN